MLRNGTFSHVAVNYLKYAFHLFLNATLLLLMQAFTCWGYMRCRICVNIICVNDVITQDICAWSVYSLVVFLNIVLVLNFNFRDQDESEHIFSYMLLSIIQNARFTCSFYTRYVVSFFSYLLISKSFTCSGYMLCRILFSLVLTNTSESTTLIQCVISR